MHKIGTVEYMTVHDVAKRLGISTQAVRIWTEKGVLKAARHPVNKYRLYRRVDVDRLLTDIQEEVKYA